MPDFSEILKIAVEQQDWQLICGLYTNITGEPLSVPTAEEIKKEEEDILAKEYSVEELKYQNQLPPEEQDLKLVDKNIDSMISTRYNDFTAPPRNTENTDTSGRRMRSESVGKTTLKNVVGVSEQGFVDDMTESLVDPETGERLVGNNKDVKITPRNKRANLGMNDTSLIDVKCSVCKEISKASPSIIFGYSENESENTWKCNDCSTRRGRRERSRGM
jgi:hypothetical protein